VQSSDASFIATTLSNVKVNQLKPRAKIIYDFAMSQSSFRSDLSLLKTHFVDPLKVMSKGVSSKNTKADLFYDTKKQIGVLKQSVQLIGGSLEVRKLQAQSKALNSNQCSNFLEALTQLGVQNNDLTVTLLKTCEDSKWSEDMKISEVLAKLDAGGVDATLLMYDDASEPTSPLTTKTSDVVSA